MTLGEKQIWSGNSQSFADGQEKVDLGSHADYESGNTAPFG
jgi:hypothetical protein